jgi:flagellar motor switch protein FliM
MTMAFPQTSPERTAARHCPELLGTAPVMTDLAPALSLIGERLTRGLAAGLARLSGGEPPIVRAGLPMDATLASIAGEIEGLAAHSLMGMGAASLPVLVIFDGAPVFRLVDRAFGGPGEVPEPLPDGFPLSAELLLSRIEGCVADALTSALAGARAPRPDYAEDHRVRPLRRDTSLRQLDPFPASADVLTLSLEIEEPGIAPWSLTLALPTETLEAALAAPQHPVRQRRAAPPDPSAEPFASMAMEVTAVLVDMHIGMTRLAGLRPGDVLPVAVARSVPLQVGGRTLASGTIGEIDDRVAVQVTHAF